MIKQLFCSHTWSHEFDRRLTWGGIKAAHICIKCGKVTTTCGRAPIDLSPPAMTGGLFPREDRMIPSEQMGKVVKYILY